MNTNKIRTALIDARDRLAGMTGVPNPLPAVNAALAELDAAPPTPTFLAVYIGTTNDTNGNPRRGWYVSRLDGEPVTRTAPDRLGATEPALTGWIEEGYNGTSTVVETIARLLGMPTKTWRDVAAVRALIRETGRINVTPSEYRAARKLPTVRA